MKKLKIIEKINILFILIVVVLLIIFFFISFLNNKKEEKNAEIEKTTSKYNYILYEDNPILYKTEFENLINVLDEEVIDKEEYAIIISKLFIIDFYTLSNKKSSYDVGGIQYIHKDLKDNFILNASNTIYKYLTNENNELPIVKGVSITSVESTKYEYNKIKYNGYIVSISWEYEKDLEYENTSNIIVIEDKEQLFIVEKKEL